MKKLTSLSSKITFYATLVVFVTMFGLSAVLFFLFRNLAVSHDNRLMINKVRLISGDVENKFIDLRKNILFLAGTPPIQGVIRATQNKGKDVEENSSLSQWKDRLAVIFASLLQNNPSYSQIRYIGIQDGGKEILRVNQTLGGEIYRVSEKNLQKKAHRSYFKEAIAKQRGSVSVSDITYNQEHGKIEDPLVPMLRVTLPIYTPQDKVFGLLVFNLNAKDFLTGLLAHSRFLAAAYVATSRGRLLVYNHLTKRVRYYKSVANSNKEIADIYASSKNLQDIKVFNDLDKIYVASPIYSNPSVDVPDFLFIYEFDKNTIFKQDFSFIYKVILTLLLSAFLASLLIYLLTKRLTIRLSRLTRSIKSIDQYSNEEVVLDKSSNDEVSFLAREFESKINMMRQLALYDSLTGLPNRKSMMDMFGRQLALAKREGKHLAVIYLDLDSFKKINDTYGHHVGDKVLVKFSQLLRKVVRKSDYCARIAGDEFTIIAYPVSHLSEVSALVTRCESELNAVLNIDGLALTITASGGVAIYPDHASTVDDLLRYADIAMYEAKNSVKGKVFVFDPAKMLPK